MGRSQMERLWLLVAGVAGLLMLVVGYLMFISPQQGQTDSVNGQVATARLRNSSLEARIAEMQQQNANLATYQAEVKQAELALPYTSGLPAFLRALQSIGNSTQATVNSLDVGAPADLTAAGAGTAPSAPSASGQAGAASPAVAVQGLHVYALPITASVSGSVTQLEQFLTQLQSVQPRAVLISAITEGSAAAGSASGNRSSLSLTMQAFVAPSSAAEQAQLSAASGR